MTRKDAEFERYGTPGFNASAFAES